ncbi:sigma factor-like helix-turn-helix DNA-binding protein [Demequina sp. SYSU T00192]|uniref:Sigma factor-like helix-turn-helix DNA-binding protein n=1 Tax=Demequina litoralis TaxID=3051660 RepID=A0ABT8GD23_9MICO|nr:sigma factor-like helix-turn-helix DNA-binding protein [Demequina sp. SYSU T00192]MDN4476952.1 sigma factor-like helix-turn-helix DNA-binding protein [Demequina sp. SYSU T00192]
MNERARWLHAVVRERGEALYARALLLTGDDAAAGDLVGLALTNGLGRGHRPESDEDAQAMVREALHRAFRRMRGEEPALVAGERAAGEPDIREALRLLTRRERVAIVLRYVDGLSASAIARQVGAPVRAVRADLASGAGRLAAARPDLRIDVDDAVEGGIEEAFSITMDGAR